VSRQSESWLDGTLISALPIPDRGLDFGDGLFETILVHQGRLLFNAFHMERLALGLQRLAIPDCLENVRRQLRDVAQVMAQNSAWAVLRVSVLRGTGPRGYAPAQFSNPRILISSYSLDSDHAHMSMPANLGIAEIRLSTQPYLAQIKHLNRLEQVIAATQAKNLGTDECILLDQEGRVVSVIAGNIFLLRERELLTPPLDKCGVAGTRRRLIMERWAHRIGLTVRETPISLNDLKYAEEIFYSNALCTVRPINRLNELSWADHSICTALFQQYLKDIS